jgi:hypothetical protein
MKHTPIVFRVDQGSYHPVFCLRQITVADDSAFLQKFIDIADKEGEERANATYQIKADILAEWVTAWPDDLKKDGKKVKRPDEALDSAETVKAFFAEADVDKDWISETALNSLRMRHSPTVSFF